MSSVVNDSKGLYTKTVCPCLVHRPHYSSRQERIDLSCARLMRFESRGTSQFFFSDTPPKFLHRDCAGRRRTGARHDNVYVSVREKKGNCCLSATCFQTVTSLDVVSLVCRGQDLPKIANFNPQQEARFSLWKKISSPRERRKWSLGLCLV